MIKTETNYVCRPFSLEKLITMINLNLRNKESENVKLNYYKLKNRKECLVERYNIIQSKEYISLFEKVFSVEEKNIKDIKIGDIILKSYYNRNKAELIMDVNFPIELKKDKTLNKSIIEIVYEGYLSPQFRRTDKIKKFLSSSIIDLKDCIPTEWFILEEYKTE